MTINNNNIFGYFTLNEARGSRLTGDWLNKESVANYGWFGGGLTPTTISAVDRIDFSNDSTTASPRGPLSAARGYLAATGNSNYGWFAGGGTIPTPATFSTVDRIDYSNDSATAVARGLLSLARRSLAATGNSNYGWFGGGYFTPPITTVSTVDRIDFSNDSPTASVRGPLSLSRRFLAATGNSNYGWFGGGTTPTGVSTVDRIDFSNDSSTASVRGPLSSVRYRSAATGNSNYGWFGGGTTPTPATVSTVDRIDFSNDSATASPRGALSLATFRLAATGNSNYGWFGGGQAASAAVERIDFSNDAVTASVRGSLSSPKNGSAAASGVLNIRRQKAGNYGWFGGGGTPAATATVNRIDFSSDSSTASPRGPLSSARITTGATGNSNYGWWAGAAPGGIGLDRVDFSNDLATASIRGTLSVVKGGATANSNYGWFGGGLPGPSTINRINFANDLATASIRGPLGVSRGGLAATGNSNYGWFSGGNTNPGSVSSSVATVESINFSNDSATALLRGSLTAARNDLSATGNSNYGWFGGGSPSGGGPMFATVDRIDFSNDLGTTSPRGGLFQARKQLAATGNSNYGWFGGGTTSPGSLSSVSTVDRINFSNDSPTLLVRSPLTLAKLGLAATSNTNK